MIPDQGVNVKLQTCLHVTGSWHSSLTSHKHVKLWRIERKVLQ